MNGGHRVTRVSMAAVALTVWLVPGLAVAGGERPAAAAEPMVMGGQKCFGWDKLVTGDCALNSYDGEKKVGGLGGHWLCLNPDGKGHWAVIAWSGDGNDTYKINVKLLGDQGNLLHSWYWEKKLDEKNKQYEWDINPADFPSNIFPIISRAEVVRLGCD